MYHTCCSTFTFPLVLVYGGLVWVDMNEMSRIEFLFTTLDIPLLCSHMDYDSMVELDEMPRPFELQRGTLHNRGAVVWRVVSEGGQRMKAAFTMLNADNRTTFCRL